LGALRSPGDEFEVPDGTKGSWFKPLADEAAQEPKAKQTGKGRRKAGDGQPDGDTDAT
jgi:hypothetical protein